MGNSQLDKAMHILLCTTAGTLDLYASKQAPRKAAGSQNAELGQHYVIIIVLVDMMIIATIVIMIVMVITCYYSYYWSSIIVFSIIDTY